MRLGRGETLVQQCSVIAQECDSESYLCFPDQDLCNPRCLGRFWTQWGECAEKINVFLIFQQKYYFNIQAMLPYNNKFYEQQK